MSNSNVLIRVEGLGKKYVLHHENRQQYTALRDVLVRQARSAGRLLNPFTLAGHLRKAPGESTMGRLNIEEEFWALKDVSFEICRGERVGIIGGNGAGKSTLLKILSRITEPTTGRVELRGRVASLLEVGTGFHPELTGRENIFLNGAILGMSRREILSKFDEIVFFAEVEKFLDTPVKRYSSGMYVRLAFSVAAHLEPEILVVDEVLAVGDASFQKKCLGKMEDVAEREGRTVLFVSHQMSSIQSLCSKGILLQRGCVAKTGDIKEVVTEYLAQGSEGLGRVDFSTLSRSGTGVAKFQDVFIVDETGSEATSIPLGSPLKICFAVRTDIEEEVCNLSIGFSIKDQMGNSISTVYSHYDLIEFSLNKSLGNRTILANIYSLPLSPGKYSLGVRMTQKGVEVDWPKGACCYFSISNSPYYLNSAGALDSRPILCIKPEWSVGNSEYV